MLIIGGNTGTGIAWGKAVRNASNAAPILTHQGFGGDPDPANTAWTASTQASVWSVLSSNELGPPVSSSVAALELDWGYWNKSDIRVSTLQNGATSTTAPGDTLWAVFRPATMPASGSLSYSSESAYILITNDSSSSAPSVDMSFDVDFLSGGITAGVLEIDSGSNEWAALFTGTISGAYASMDISSGSLNVNTPLNLGTSHIGGAFIGTTDPAAPAFLGGFTLEASGNFIQGMTVLCSDCNDD